MKKIKAYPQFEGRVQMTRDGNLFVIVEGQEEDIFVKASKSNHALNGDTVLVALTKTNSRPSALRYPTLKSPNKTSIILP